MNPAKLKIARSVRPHHANTFAEEWFRLSYDEMSEAFEETQLMPWPLIDGTQMTPSQARYCEIEAEIFNRMFDLAKPAIMEAFLKVATEVLGRERSRPIK
jgi:hypothetical protein